MTIDLAPAPTAHPLCQPTSSAARLGQRQTPRPVRTAVLARDEIVQRGLIQLLAGEPSIRVVAHHSDFASLESMLEDQLVDMVVLDLEGDSDDPLGVEDARSLKRLHPRLKIVVLAGGLSDEDVLGAVCGGVDAVVSRSSPGDDLLAVFRQAARGEPALDRRFTAAMVRALRAQGRTSSAALTAREREVVALVALGQRNSAIARSLFITESTVKFHLRNLMEKLGTSSRAELVSIALRLGLA